MLDFGPNVSRSPLHRLLALARLRDAFFSLSFLLSLFQSSYISLFFSFSTTFLCVCASLALPPPPHPLPHLALSTSHPRNSLSLNSLFSLRHSTHTNLFTSLLRLLFFPFSHDDDFRYGTTTKTTTRFMKNPLRPKLQ